MSNTPCNEAHLSANNDDVSVWELEGKRHARPIPLDQIVVPPESTTLANKSLQMSTVTPVDENLGWSNTPAQRKCLAPTDDDVTVWELEGKRHALANPLENCRAT